MSAIKAVPGRAEILKVLRSIIRVAREFPEYNIREYTKRRAIDGFRQNKTLTDPHAVNQAFADAKSQLQVAKRQAVVYSLYAPKVPSIMDLPN